MFEAGGRLYLLNLATEKASEVAIQVITDRTTLKPRTESVAELIREAAPSPTGKRAVFEARGDVFTVPAEHGPVLNLTRSSGSAERYPRWSPDGKTLAYWTDRSGEYELVLRPADGTGTEKTVTTLGPGYRYPVQWSPDSARLAFIDQTETLRLLDVASGKLTEIDQVPIWMAHEQPGEPAAALVGRLALADLGASASRRPPTPRSSSTTRSARRSTRSRPATSPTSHPSSIPTASISTSSRTAPSSRSTATSTTAGRIPTRRASSRWRCARTSPRRSPPATTSRATTRTRTKDDEKDGDKEKDADKAKDRGQDAGRQGR